MILTYRYRVKNLSGFLNEQARAVNIVWNWCNDTQKHALKWGKKWPTAFDLVSLASGASHEMSVGSMAIEATCMQYVTSRRTKNRPYLRYRGKKALGWIPVKARSIRQREDGFRFSGQIFRVFDSRPIPEGAVIKDGSSFSQDAKGNWYLNIVLDIPDQQTEPTGKAVGIDLGLKDLATLSTGEQIENPRHFRKLEETLGKAQRARKKRQARNIYQKIKNARRDHLHKVSTRIAKEFDRIVIGGVKSAPLKKTRMAKSISDVGWYAFKTMLKYKAIARGATVEEVNEAFTTQTCSECGSISGPKGREGLVIREWKCQCGAVHNRDHNAAINILRLGQETPVVGAVV